MMRENNLDRARKVCDDEFYTLYEDIAVEMEFFKDYLKGKVVYCNCDTEQSNFVKFFNDVKDEWSIKEVIYSGMENFGYHWEIDKLEKADVVITNPPFSTMRDYLDFLLQYNKKFIFIGSINCITYKDFFKEIKAGKLYVNEVNKSYFIRPDGSKVHVACNWYNNIMRVKGRELNLTKSINDMEVVKYDNYDAVEINKISDIPYDYFGEMGVSVTIFQFDIEEKINLIGMLSPIINEKKVYMRIIIKRKS